MTDRTDQIVLGEITCPSGELVVMDGGYLGLWSGLGSPQELEDAGVPPGVDFEVIGPDAVSAARMFDRQEGLTLYDIPAEAADEFTGLFEATCKEHSFDAALRRFERQVPHLERVRRAIAGGDSGFLISGVPVIVASGIPAGPLRVTAVRADGDDAWEHIRIGFGDAPVESVRLLDQVGVDYARLVFADAHALSHWVHDDPLDGLADVVFWGLHEKEVAQEFDAPRIGTGYGWLDLPVDEAYAKAVALDERRHREPERRFAFDFRPHSHHWQVMAGVRAAEHEAASIEVGGAQVMFAMTSVGDGFFPVHLECDEAGAPAGLRISILAG